MGGCLHAGDDNLIRWTKNKEPAIALPPQGMALTGFRDPYIIQKGGQGQKWKLILGSGVKEQGGTILLYESDSASSGKHTCIAFGLITSELSLLGHMQHFDVHGPTIE